MEDRPYTEHEIKLLREHVDSEISWMIDAIGTERRERLESLKVRKPGRAAKAARQREDERLEVAESALHRIRERVWDADPDTLDLIRDALQVPHALLTHAERDVSVQKRRALGSLGAEHVRHYEWKELAVTVRRVRPKYSDEECARAIKDGKSINGSNDGLRTDAASAGNILTGLGCRKCPDPPGYRRGEGRMRSSTTNG